MRDNEALDTAYLDSVERLVAADRLRPLLDNPSPVFDSIAQHAAGIADTPIALISLLDHSQQRFVGVHGTTLGSTSRDVALCALVVEGTTELTVADAHADDRFKSNPLVTGPFGLRSYAGTPLTFDDHIVGALCVIDHRPREFDDRCRMMLNSLATTVTVMLAAHLESIEPGPIGSHYAEQALNALGQAVVVTDLSDRVTWANGASQQIFDTTTPIGQELGELVDPPNGSGLPHRRLTQRIAPLLDADTGDIAGTIHTFTDVTASETRRLRLERLVNTDALTQIANRRSFESQLNYEIDLYTKGTPSGSVAVGILDLDGFKAINDQLGHAVGDEVLVQVAQCIAEEVSHLGGAARLGGDEFAMLLHDTDMAEACRVGDRVERAIQQIMGSKRDVRQGLSASIGVSLLRRSDRTPGDVLRRADIACYEAKQNGGSCVRSMP